MEHNVIGCIDCPMFYMDNNERYGIETYCNHPHHKTITIEDIHTEIDKTNNIVAGERVPITPNWCPLNKEPITIIKT